RSVVGASEDLAFVPKDFGWFVAQNAA
ncbi:MAG: hypothetical protein NOOUEUKL_001216, partial [Candidatus Fervidibacter sp.]